MVASIKWLISKTPRVGVWMQTLTLLLIAGNSWATGNQNLPKPILPPLEINQEYVKQPVELAIFGETTLFHFCKFSSIVAGAQLNKLVQGGFLTKESTIKANYDYYAPFYSSLLEEKERASVGSRILYSFKKLGRSKVLPVAYLSNQQSFVLFGNLLHEYEAQFDENGNQFFRIALPFRGDPNGAQLIINTTYGKLPNLGRAYEFEVLSAATSEVASPYCVLYVAPLGYKEFTLKK